MVTDVSEEGVDVVLLRFRGKEVEADVVVLKPKDVELDEDIVDEIIARAVEDFREFSCYWWDGNVIREAPCHLISKEAFIAKDIGDYMLVIDKDVVEVELGKEVSKIMDSVRDAEVKVVNVKPYRS